MTKLPILAAAAAIVSAATAPAFAEGKYDKYTPKEKPPMVAEEDDDPFLIAPSFPVVAGIGGAAAAFALTAGSSDSTTDTGSTTGTQ